MVSLISCTQCNVVATLRVASKFWRLCKNSDLQAEQVFEEEFDALIAFVEKRTGLEFVDYPKFNFYTLEGYRDYSAASYLDDFDKDYEERE